MSRSSRAPLAAVGGGLRLLGGAVDTVPTWTSGALGRLQRGVEEAGRAGLREKEPEALGRVWSRGRLAGQGAEPPVARGWAGGSVPGAQAVGVLSAYTASPGRFLST